jgi:5-methylcytosine-specific restriction endonuclease McrA
MTKKTGAGDWPPTEETFGKLSKAKKDILKILWSMNWTEGAEIFKAVQQTYYDRRARELRESGWQIETAGTKYRLISHKKLAGNVRKYPSKKQKQAVLERDKDICQICGVADPHMQFDHKVPQERLGLTEAENLQLLCRTCNVEKRGVCKRCMLSTCDKCPYAYPELVTNRFLVSLYRDLASKLKSDSKQLGITETRRISEIIALYYAGDSDKNSGL